MLRVGLFQLALQMLAWAVRLRLVLARQNIAVVTAALVQRIRDLEPLVGVPLVVHLEMAAQVAQRLAQLVLAAVAVEV